MKFPFLQDPETGKPSEFVTMSVLGTLAVIFRFLFDGAVIHVFSHTLTFTRLDASVYLSLLGPLLGAHSYVKVKGQNDKEDK